MIYRLNVTPAGDAYPIADAHGDLDTVAYLVRKLNLQPGTEYTATINDLKHIGGDVERSVASVTGDHEIVNYVLGKRLRAERAALAGSEATTPAEPAAE